MNNQPFKGNIPPPHPGQGAPEKSLRQPRSGYPGEDADPAPLRERRTDPKGRPEFILMTPEKQQQLLEANAAAAFEAERRAAENSTLDRGLLTLLGAVVFLLAGAGLGWGLGRLQRPDSAAAETAAPRSAMPPARAEERSPTETAADAARAAVNALAGARSTEERLDWVLNPERVKPLLEKYYDEGGRDDRMLAEPVWETLPVRPEEMDLGVSVLGGRVVLGTEPRAFVLFFKRDPRAPEKYRLDWETYVQQREDTLSRFLNDPGSPASVFRVHVERKHLFDENGESQEGCVVRCLAGGASGEIFVGESGPFHRRLTEDLKWGQPRIATLELEWQKSPSGAGGRTRPAISRFYCWQLAGVQVEPEAKPGDVLLPPPPAAGESPQPDSP